MFGEQWIVILSSCDSPTIIMACSNWLFPGRSYMALCMAFLYNMVFSS